MPRKILTLDCETDPFKKGRLSIKPFIWGLYDGQTFSTFTDSNELRKVLERENYIIYAHNGGKFDYHFLLDFVNPYEPIMVVNARIAKMRIGACEFRDSYSILPMSQEQLIGKYKIDYDILESTEREKPQNKQEIYNRLKQDCIDLYDLVSNFTQEYGMNLTLASSAFRMWRKISGQKNPKTTRGFYDAIHPFYYGGRVQCFKLGEIKENFSVYDVNSAYPKAMLSNHPYGSSFSVSTKLPRQDVELAFIEVECQSLGQFPFRTPNGLYFPNDGELRKFTVTGHEFVCAESLGLLKEARVTRVLSFAERINFEQYVNYFFRLKEEAEKAGDKIKRNNAKLFLNGLYGKFAAAPHEYKEYMPIPQQYINASSKENWVYNSMFGKYALMTRPLAEEKHNYYNLATGASITGYQRAVMMKGLNDVRTPLYCDTDSIVCLSAGTLNIGTNLGEWKKEAVCDYGAIAGKKLYAFRRYAVSELGRNKKNRIPRTFKIASKGVRLSAGEIIRIAKGEEIQAENIAPTFTIHKEPYFTKRKIKMKKELQQIQH